MSVLAESQDLARSVTSGALRGALLAAAAAGGVAWRKRRADRRAAEQREQHGDDPRA